MKTEEKIEIVEKVEEVKKINLEEEFKKLQQKVEELSKTTKEKDEIILKNVKEKEALEKQYELLYDTHKLLKENISPNKEEESDFKKFVKETQITNEELSKFSDEELKIFYNTIINK